MRGALVLLFPLVLTWPASAFDPGENKPLRPQIKEPCSAQLEPWTNLGNRDFYETLTIEQFRERARLTGMESCSDLKRHPAADALKEAKTVLEFGAGYGRVIECLRRHYQHLEKVYAVERSSRFVDYQRRVFGDDQKLMLFEDDILQFRLPHQTTVDVVLWMWSGFAEFNPKEQNQGLNAAYRALRPGGKLVIDLAASAFDSRLATRGSAPGFAQIEDRDRTLYLYLPEDRDLWKAAQSVGFTQADEFEYQTQGALPRPRVQYVYTKAAP